MWRKETDLPAIESMVPVHLTGAKHLVLSSALKAFQIQAKKTTYKRVQQIAGDHRILPSHWEGTDLHLAEVLREQLRAGVKLVIREQMLRMHYKDLTELLLLLLPVPPPPHTGP